MPVLYGGSVKPENAAELLSQPAVDGALVGGASLDVDSFAAICRGSVALVALVILDGWGCAPPGPGNAVELAETPVFDRLWRDVPAHDARRLGRGGRAAGGPDGQLGGRPPDDRLGPHPRPGPPAREPRDRDGALFENEALVGAFDARASAGGDVHLLGLVSYGGVHSHIDHLRALLELARAQGMAERTWIHAFTDGRDVSPTSAVRDLAELPAERIATVVGRYYAMDRDKRWERTQTRARRDRGGRGYACIA